MSAPPATKALRSAKAPFRQTVLVCGKCERKLGRGFGEGGRKPLRKALKRALKSGAWGRKVRVVETSCLDLCPKRRQVAATPHGLTTGRLTVVEPGTPAEAVLDALLGPAEPALAPPPAHA